MSSSIEAKDSAATVVGHLDLTPEQREYYEQLTGHKTTKLVITQQIESAGKRFSFGSASW